MEAWDVFDGSETLGELMKDSERGIEEFLKVWRKEAGNWKACPVCKVGAAKGGTGERKSNRRKRKWFDKHFEEVHWRVARKSAEDEDRLTVRIPSKFWR